MEVGAALELANIISLLNGNVSSQVDGGNSVGVNVQGEQLNLNGLGDPSLGDSAALDILPFGVNSNNSPSAGPLDDPIGTTEDEWGGPVNLSTTLAVTFQGTLGAIPQPTLTANITNLTGTSQSKNIVTTTAGVSPLTGFAAANAVQGITFGGTITGGTFTLTYTPLIGGTAVTTGNIPWSPNAATLAANIQTALDTALATTSANLAVAPIADGTINVPNTASGTSRLRCPELLVTILPMV